MTAPEPIPEEYSHDWVLDSVDGSAGGEHARMVKLHCTRCPETIQKLTTKTDEEIAAELEAAKDANG